MKRAASEIALTAQTAWERWEGPILVVACCVWLFIAAAIGASR